MHELDDITGAVIDAAINIHRELGPGLLESVYELVLAHEVERRGFRVERQRAVRIEYAGLVFEQGFRADLVVEARVVVEIKSVEQLAPVHSKQILTYLRLMHLEVGLLINFGNVTFKEGLHRVVNGLSPSASPRFRVNSEPLNPRSRSARRTTWLVPAASAVRGGSRHRSEAERRCGLSFRRRTCSSCSPDLRRTAARHER